jgi:hypothetical protein
MLLTIYVGTLSKARAVVLYQISVIDGTHTRLSFSAVSALQSNSEAEVVKGVRSLGAVLQFTLLGSMKKRDRDCANDCNQYQ